MKFSYTFGKPEKGCIIKNEQAVRGIILNQDNSIIMVTSIKYQDYCFPGGGKESGESDLDALIREVREETGYDIDILSVKDFCVASTYFKDRNRENTCIYQISNYYLCKGTKKFNLQLTYSEVEEGLSVVQIDIDEAIKNNELLKEKGYCWVERELCVLNKLKKYLGY